MGATSAVNPAHWPAGLPRSLDYPDVPVGAILAGAARRWGDRTAFHYAGRDLSFAELARQAARFAHGLRARGVGRGDVVALHLPNIIQFPVAYYGTLLAGATFSPCNPLLPPDDLAFQLADCGAVAVVTLDFVAAPVAQALDRTKVRTVIIAPLGEGPADVTGLCDGAFAECGVDFAAVGEGQPDTFPEVEIDTGADLAHIAYTGGTTGRSKGVMITHRKVVTNALQYACWGSGSVPALDGEGGLTLDQVGSEEEYPVRLGTGVIVNVAPWFHAMGTIGYLNMPVMQGATVVVHPRLDVPAFLADMEKFRATTLGGAPALFSALMADPSFETRDLSSVRAVSSGAAPLAVEMLHKLNEKFPDATVVEAYGLSEVTMGATANPPHRSGERRLGTVGVPVFDTQVKVVAADAEQVDDSTPALPAGAEGEVCVKGPQVMVGYLNRPEETAAVLGEDGWLRTGDIGVVDEDGFVSIVDRKKDMLIYNGYNVYPRELEEILFTHPAVAQAAVVGRPDPRAGELPTAFVVKSGEVTAEELMAYVNEKVVPYKKLREIVFTDEIPVSAAGKVLKRELRERL
ncbi:class I adenylate-forming enzyme family protein [Thermomonospora cellulosilytica]|uniref:Long-chain acyl-CoA synthetase n=1 Tax=Thermomonospora cellulosilytica TaxID=1411118 RepID=A0A7W3N3B6_9ACTN|nr:AMP-binding protein [Thermomonospora cellulosilytica]MBA9006747.1 long-chain acyl-CoA synthetase [Thermomonospora cellulosilytica]